jgi:hypothetical protein
MDGAEGHHLYDFPSCKLTKLYLWHGTQQGERRKFIVREMWDGSDGPEGSNHDHKDSNSIDETDRIAKVHRTCTNDHHLLHIGSDAKCQCRCHTISNKGTPIERES